MKSSDHEPTLVVPGTVAPLVEPELSEAQEQFRLWLRATYPGIKVLFTSGYTDQIIAQDDECEPGLAFLAKPYTLATLAGRVRGLLDGAS